MTSKNPFHTIAFYNTENLFDVFVDDKTIGNDFVPFAPKKWTRERYSKKIENVGFVISKIGLDTAQKPPVLIGLAEIENAKVLKDLIRSKALAPHAYQFVHYDSSDERGIDVALLYNKDEFRLEASKAFPVYAEELSGVRDFTRDILLVTGYLEGKKIHILVNHWPSRHQGSDATETKRLQAAKQLSDIILALKKEDANVQIVIMGDFNDNPNSQSIQNLKNENQLFNAMESVWSYSRGSTNHNFTWLQFDQILVSYNFLDAHTSDFKFLKSNIFDPQFLKESKGKYKGQPLRTYIGKKYKGGFSDHFPVYVQIGIDKK